MSDKYPSYTVRQNSKKTYSVIVHDFTFLTSDQISFVLRLAPLYVLSRSHADDMVFYGFRTKREASVFVRSYNVLMSILHLDPFHDRHLVFHLRDAAVVAGGKDVYQKEGK